MPSSSPGDAFSRLVQTCTSKLTFSGLALFVTCTREIKGLQLALAQSLDNMMPWIPQVEHQRQQ